MTHSSPYRWIQDAMKVKTQFPFKATINGEEVIVWDDWIEYPSRDLYEPDYEQEEDE